MWYFVLTGIHVLEGKPSIYSYYKKSVIERTIHYVKDRTESFDDHFSCRKKKCKLDQVRQWLILFADYYNKEVIRSLA